MSNVINTYLLYETGLDGDAGEKGEPGIVGRRGDKGQKGEGGAAGDVGPKGEVGLERVGPAGDKGK